MRNNFSYFYFMTVVFLFLLGGWSCHKGVVTTEPATANWITNSERKCSQDSDCIVVKADCCGCNQGGTQTGVNQKFLADIQGLAKKACRDVMCIQMISNHPSCRSNSAICLNGLCNPDPNGLGSKRTNKRPPK